MAVARLGWRLLSWRDVVQALAVVAVPLAVLLALFMTVHALTLSPVQYSDLSFGRFEGSVQLPGTSETLDGTAPPRVVDEIRREAPAGQSAVVLTGASLQFDELPRSTNVGYIEADWPERPYGDRFTALAGRMPQRPGEVAVPEGLFENPLGRTLSADSGNVKLKVVGVIQDRFARSSTDVLGAKGTFASFDWQQIRRAGFFSGAIVNVLGNFRDWDKLREISARYQEQYLGGAAEEAVNNRSMVAASPPESFVEQEPLVYRAPATALAVLCPLFLLGLRGRRARRWSAILRAVGVRPGRSALAVTGGSIVLALAAVPVGAVAGQLLGLLVRLAPLSNAPLSPAVTVVGEAARFVAVAVVAMLAAGLLTASRQRGYSVQELLRWRAPARLLLAVRLLVLLVALGGIAFLVPGIKAGTNNPTISLLAAVAVCLVIPEVLVGVRRASAGRGVRWRLVSGRLMIDRGKSVAVCAALIGCIGPFVAISAERAAGEAFQRETRVTLIPLGQVAVTKPPNSGFDRVDPRALEITKRVSGQQPIEVTQLTSDRDLYASPAGAIVAPNGRVPQASNFQALLGVPSIGALRRLLADNLTAHAAAVVAGGGVLHFAGFGPAIPSRAPIGMSRDNVPGTRLENTTRPVSVASIPNDHAWSSQGTGFILNSTARRLGLPMHVHLSVFTGITPAKAEQITSALRRAGLPERVLLRTEPFQLIPQPAGLVFGRYGLLLLLAVLMTVALGSSARSLRKESRSLIAIGLRRSWPRRALALQSLTLTAVGLLGGLVAGAVPILIYLTRLRFTVVVPIGQLAILVAGSMVIAVVTALLASRGLTPRRSSS